jgi:hypothetical protein
MFAIAQFGPFLHGVSIPYILFHSKYLQYFLSYQGGERSVSKTALHRYMACEGALILFSGTTITREPSILVDSYDVCGC